MYQRQPPQPNVLRQTTATKIPAWIECPVRRRLPSLRREKLGVCRQVRVSDAAIAKRPISSGVPPGWLPPPVPARKAAQRVEQSRKTAAKVRHRATPSDFSQRLGRAFMVVELSRSGLGAPSDHLRRFRRVGRIDGRLPQPPECLEPHFAHKERNVVLVPGIAWERARRIHFHPSR